MDAGTVRGWAKQFDALAGRVGPCFGRHDLRSQATGYLRGLLGSVERKNSWQLSEHLGREKPYGIQRLLGRASWDADAVRDALIQYATEHLVGLGDRGIGLSGASRHRAAHGDGAATSGTVARLAPRDARGCGHGSDSTGDPGLRCLSGGGPNGERRLVAHHRWDLVCSLRPPSPVDRDKPHPRAQRRALAGLRPEPNGPWRDRRQSVRCRPGECRCLLISTRTHL